MPVKVQAEFIQNAFAAGAFDGDRNATNYLQYNQQSTSMFGDRATSYANAFGAGTLVDWLSFLKDAVKAHHKGDFRF